MLQYCVKCASYKPCFNVNTLLWHMLCQFHCVLGDFFTLWRPPPPCFLLLVSSLVEGPIREELLQWWWGDRSPFTSEIQQQQYGDSQHYSCTINEGHLNKKKKGLLRILSCLNSNSRGLWASAVTIKPIKTCSCLKKLWGSAHLITDVEEENGHWSFCPLENSVSVQYVEKLSIHVMGDFFHVNITSPFRHVSL